MTVKFIVVADGRVLFGKCHHGSDYHRNIAERHLVRRGDVRGGGLADLVQRRIFGTSYGFGPYEPEVIRQLLPGWQVEAPSSY